MGLFRNYYYCFLISFLFSLDSEINNILDFSFSDFSVISNSEFQFNVGIQSNNLLSSIYFFSIDKLISNNLFFSTKIAKYEYEYPQIYNQNSLSYASKNSSINYSFSFNYLTNNKKINRWNNLGIFSDYKIKNKAVLLYGIYIDFKNNNNSNWHTTNYYVASRFKLSNSITSLISLVYNPDYSIMNQSLEFSVKL